LFGSTQKMRFLFFLPWREYVPVIAIPVDYVFDCGMVQLLPS